MAFIVVAAQVAMVAGAAASVYGQVEAGKAQQDALNEQARQEKIAAEGRELQRREQLNAQLAANNAALASSGIATEGTPASIALESAKAISASEGMIGLSEKLKRRELKMRGKMAKQTGYLNALGTGLSLAMRSGAMSAGGRSDGGAPVEEGTPTAGKNP